MNYLNVAIKGLNWPYLGWKPQRVLKKMRPHIKMLSGDYYTYKMKAYYQWGSPHCRLCQKPSPHNENEEDFEHILTVCSAYTEVRNRIFEEMGKICEQSRGWINFKDFLENLAQLVQFILNGSSLNLPSRFNYEEILCSNISELSRDLCFSINKTRLDRMVRWSEDSVSHSPVIIIVRRLSFVWDK